MENKIYIRRMTETKSKTLGLAFGFVVSEVHKINENDIEITQEIYDRFFEEQNNGRSFKAKKVIDKKDTFEDIFEEVVNPQLLPEFNSTEISLEERVRALEKALKLKGVK